MGWIYSEMCRSKARLDSKTIVLTGGSAGLGKETALEFFKRGAKVVMACRNKEKTVEVINEIKNNAMGLVNVGSLIFRELDLSSFESVRKCAKQILDTEPTIHLLVNNAGIMACPKYLSKDGYELQFATNHLGHFLFTLLLLPRIIKSAPARIVNVASNAHHFGDGKMHLDDINLDKKKYTPWAAYGRSKTANILFSVELARRLKGTGVSTYSLHPGVIHTELWRHIEQSHPWTHWIMKNLTKPFMKTPVQGIQTTLYCSLDERCANETGLYYAECSVAIPYTRARNEIAAKELWDESIKITKLENYDPFTPV